jgi:hypothetical protein
MSEALCHVLESLNIGLKQRWSSIGSPRAATARRIWPHLDDQLELEGRKSYFGKISCGIYLCDFIRAANSMLPSSKLVTNLSRIPWASLVTARSYSHSMATTYLSKRMVRRLSDFGLRISSNRYAVRCLEGVGLVGAVDMFIVQGATYILILVRAFHSILLDRTAQRVLGHRVDLPRPAQRQIPVEVHRCVPFSFVVVILQFFLTLIPDQFLCLICKI